jgi:predicted nuclease of predicted toxin-antitoxin system
MRIKLDENLPESLVASLAALGHDVDNVRLEGVSGQSDPAVWSAAQDGIRL